MKKAYMCINHWMDDDGEESFIALADNEEQAYEEIAKRRSKDESYQSWLFDDSSLGELIEDLGGRDIFALLKDGEDKFAMEVYKAKDLDTWQVEEIENDFFGRFFVVSSTDNRYAFRLSIVDEDPESQIIDLLANDLKDDEPFKEYIRSMALNAGLIGWIENNGGINAFFSDRVDIGTSYKKYLQSENKAFLSDEFDYYCAKKCIELGIWDNYVIEEIVGGAINLIT